MRDVTLYEHRDGSIDSSPLDRHDKPVPAVVGVTVAEIQANKWKARQADKWRAERDAARAEAAIWLARHAARCDD